LLDRGDLEFLCVPLSTHTSSSCPELWLRSVYNCRGDSSDQYQALLNEHGFACSMSRKDNCWDNAVAERFFLNLKIERVWQRNYANQAEAKLDVADYIAGFYNCERLHSVLGNLPPSVYERAMAEKELIVVSEIT
jgi:putative transposase